MVANASIVMEKRSPICEGGVGAGGGGGGGYYYPKKWNGGLFVVARWPAKGP